MRRSFAIALLALIALAWAPPAPAQCAMCREAAAAQRAEAARAFNRAILVLGAPPAFIAVGLGLAVWRRRDGRGVGPTDAGLQ